MFWHPSVALGHLCRREQDSLPFSPGSIQRRKPSVNAFPEMGPMDRLLKEAVSANADIRKRTTQHSFR